MFQRQQKKCLNKFIALIFMIAILGSFVNLSTVWAANAPSLRNVRISYSLTQTRIVCDFDVAADFKDSFDTKSNEIDVYFPKAVNNVRVVPAVQAASRLVQGLSLANDPDGGVHLVIANKQAVQYKVYNLNNPVRTVIDIVASNAPNASNNGSTVDVAAVKDDGGSTSSVQLGKGLIYQKMIKYTANGPVKAFVLRIAANSDYRVVPALSNGMISGLATVSNIVRENGAIAGINASYFNTDGQILGLLMIDREFVSTSDVLRTSLGFGVNGKVVIDQMDYVGSVSLPDGQKVAIDAVNRERGENMLVLYNHYYAQSTDTNSFGVDYVLQGDIVTDIKPSDAVIPKDGVVLSVHGSRAAAFSNLKIGDRVIVEQKIDKSLIQLQNVIGAGPFLVRERKPFITSKAEEFPSDIAFGRAPRTAVGVAADGGVLLVVLDGRQRDSIGMTLQELADFMIELGAVNALNMDGGGSSEMYVNGQVVNSPSDGRERRVGDVIAVVPKK